MNAKSPPALSFSKNDNPLSLSNKMTYTVNQIEVLTLVYMVW